MEKQGVCSHTTDLDFDGWPDVIPVSLISHMEADKLKRLFATLVMLSQMVDLVNQ